MKTKGENLCILHTDTNTYFAYYIHIYHTCLYILSRIHKENTSMECHKRMFQQILWFIFQNFIYLFI